MSGRQIRRARQGRIEREAERERRLGTRSKVVIAAGAALGATALAAPAAEAGTFTVTSLDDDGDDGTLRTEVYEANLSSGPDTVVFQSGLSGTIVLDNPAPLYTDIDVSAGALTIQGPGADVITVDGNGTDNIFEIQSGLDESNYEFSISGLTLTGGDTSTDPPGNFNDGGAIFVNDGEEPHLTVADSVLVDNSASDVGGAIASEGSSLTITNSVVRVNHADSRGGGINTQPQSLTITGSTVADNSTDSWGGGLYATGGIVEISNSAFTGNAGDWGGGASITSTESAEIDGSVFSGNEAENDGGGLYLFSLDGGASVTRSTFMDNDAGDAGGGVYSDDPDSGNADVIFDAVTIANNTSGGVGGGIFLDDDGNDPLNVLQNSTVSGNIAADAGGGVYVRGGEGGEGVVIRNSTIAENAADGRGGGIYRDSYNVAADGYGGAKTTVSSTIVANNSSPSGPDVADNPEINTGAGLGLGFSLVESSSGASIDESPAGSNIFGADPLLGPLQSNGGPTQTHAPAFNSPVLDTGIANGLATDQRGLVRVQDLSAIANAAGGDATDIGAVEVQPADCQGQTVPKLDGTAGDDTLTGTDGPESISGLAGADTASGSGGNDCVNGDEGKDNVKGGPGKDLVKGGAGKDKGSGGGGKDKVKGAGGKDKLKGGGGKDNVSGGGGKDKLSGGGGKDKLKGGGGKDKLKGGGGKDRFNCGGGKDKVTADAKDKVSASCEKVVEKG